MQAELCNKYPLEYIQMYGTSFYDMCICILDNECISKDALGTYTPKFCYHNWQASSLFVELYDKR